MTRAEFDGWVEQHYGELVKVARRRVNSDEAAEDAAQHAIASALESGGYETRDAIWPWMVLKVRDGAKLQRRSESRFRDLRREAKKVSSAGLSLGWKRPAPQAE